MLLEVAVFDDEKNICQFSYRPSRLLGGYSPEVVFSTILTALYVLLGSRGVHG